MSQIPLEIFLIDIRSAYNVGAIFRTCDGAGVRKLYLSGFTPYPPHERIPKTALGAIDFVEWEHCLDPESKLRELQREGKKLIIAETGQDSKSLFDFKFSPNSVIVFGNEVNGVSENIRTLSESMVSIPMFGQKESLNVATAVGVFAYFAGHQLASKL